MNKYETACVVMFIKYKVRQAGATFLDCVLVYMVVDSMNERMCGFC